MNANDLFPGTPRQVPTAPPGGVQIVGAASGLGAAEPGCADGPARLRLAGLDAHLAARGVAATWAETLFPDQAPGEPVAQVVCRLCERLARTTAKIVRSGSVPLVLGGDHSIAMGTWRGVAGAVEGRLGLLWIDAHLDAHTPETSHSGKLHGMPLAALLGQTGDALCEPGAALSPEHVCVVGVRSFEPEEGALAAALGVRIYTMAEIDRRGLPEVLREAAARVRTGTVGYGITLDLDAIDPADAPGVTTPVAGGLRAAALLPELAALAKAAAPIAIEITEYEPHRDRGGATARLVEELASAMLGGGAARSVIELERRYSAANYDPLPVVLARGEGVHVWDQAGRRYLDMMSAYSAVSLGHGHPRILRALTEQAKRLAVTSRAYHNDRLPPFLERLCRMTGMDRALPVNTGLEAVETALKAARKWAHKVKRVPDGRAEIIACEGNFHGRSITITGMSSEAQYRDGFGPFPRGFKLVPYGDAQALARAITPDTAAFLVEPIQGERGIVVPPAGYLAECARICRERNVLFIADEVQTGLGRTGKLLACEHDGVQPDGLVLGKALGGGVLPVSAFLARDEVMQVFRAGRPRQHVRRQPARGGGRPRSAQRHRRRAPRRARHDARRAPADRSRGDPEPARAGGARQGPLIGVDIDPRYATARLVVDRLLAHGILSKDTHGTVVRFAPPLVITREEIDWAIDETRKVLEEIEREVKRAA